MTEAWTRWEGHVVNGEFCLQKYLGGSNQSGVFLTDWRGRVLRQAAIKFIPASVANSNLYPGRWSQAEKLSHPHLIRLLEKGRCQLGGADLLFVVMEYAEENLAEILSERALTPAEVRDLLQPTLEALGYLHSQGFVHGHLKPANILAARDQLKLASDGVCGTGEAALVFDIPNAYDPPEKSNGANSPSADIWSLGMTLAEALTQHLPSGREKEDADPVIPEDLPAPLFDIVRGCLRRDPRSRWSIADIASRLRPTPAAPRPQAQPQPELQPQPQAQPQSQAAVRSHQAFPKRSLVGPSIIAALTVAVVLGGLGLLHRQTEASQAAPAAPPASKPDPPQAELPSPTLVQPASQSAIHLTSESSSKPSPVPGRREVASTISDSRPVNLVTTINPSSANGDVVRELLPDVPQSALDTIQGTIRVAIKVQVDSAGNVIASELDSAGPSRYFARLATQAAQDWKFTPSSQEPARQFILHFDFRNTETKGFATRTP